MTDAARIFYEPTGVASRLSVLNLTDQDIRSAAEYALQGALDAATGLDTLGAAGSGLYHRLHRGLREVLIPRGWTINRANNMETTVHPTGRFAICVLAGNSGTGYRGRRLTTRREQGPATRNVAERNFIQAVMFAEGEVSRLVRPLPERLVSTWAVVHFLDRDAEMLRLELALPSEVATDGTIIDWADRIILAAIPYTLDSEAAIDDVGAEDSDDAAYNAEILPKAE